jgi:glycerol kinase
MQHDRPVTQPLLLALDQGTTSTRAILFESDGTIVALAQRELPQIYPKDGWVEHDPERIWSDALAVCREALEQAAGRPVAALGITNQRETTVVWELASGRAVHNAIVWQDRRGAELCDRLAAAGHEPDVQRRTGLVLDSYFSASKVAWLLDNQPGLRRRAAAGEIAFGTIDCFLIWRLTAGRVHATDVTNAARTLLFDIGRGRWDDDLLALFGVPRAMLPEVRPSAADFGSTDIFGRSLPIRGAIGDQHAALVGQGCLAPGLIKATFGTGCFVLANTGTNIVRSRNRLLATPAYALAAAPAYALEGSAFNVGTAIKWLRDGLGVIHDARETEVAARAAGDNHGVYFVPAFTGLGAPFWDPKARGTIVGLTRAVDRPTLIRAALEAAAYQAADLIDAMRADGTPDPVALRVDGGMAANDWLMQFLADVIALPVERPRSTETTALGAALTAGLGAGILESVDAVGRAWRSESRFVPGMSEAERHRLRAGWADAVTRSRGR